MDKDFEIIIRELNANLKNVKTCQLDEMAESIVRADRVYTYGCGRSGFAMMSFGMRIMHLGKECHYVHDTCVPPIRKNDLLIVASGSGNTESTVAVARRAEKVSCRIALVTENRNSILGEMADVILEIPWDHKYTVQPLGNCYDQTQNVVLDTIIYKAMNILGINEDIMDRNHTNIE